MDYKVLDIKGNVLGYVVNSSSVSDAERMAKRSSEEYTSLQEEYSLNIPSMFQNCFMDEHTVSNFKGQGRWGEGAPGSDSYFSFSDWCAEHQGLGD